MEDRNFNNCYNNNWIWIIIIFFGFIFLSRRGGNNFFNF